MTFGPATPITVLTVGELMWDILVEPPGTLEHGERLRRVPGGAAANVARALAKHRMSVAVLGVVSSDPLGRALVGALSRAGIDVSLVSEADGRMGLVFFDLIQRERCVAYRPSAVLPSLVALPAGWLDARHRPTVLHIAALTADVPSLVALTALASEARTRGAWVVVDLNARPRAFEPSAEKPALPIQALTPLLAVADVVKGSAGDVGLVERATGASLEGAVRHAGDAAFIVTRASAPSSACGPFGSMELPVAAQIPVRSMGAGDAFAAGLVSVLSSARKSEAPHASLWHRALAEAHAWAARHVTTPVS